MPLVLETLLGRVEYVRQWPRCRGCGADVYPLDEALGLLAGTGSTLGVREQALWAVVEVSYAKTSEFLAKFAGLAVSHGSLHWAQKEGRLVELHAHGAQERTFGAPARAEVAALKITVPANGATVPVAFVVRGQAQPGSLVVVRVQPRLVGEPQRVQTTVLAVLAGRRERSGLSVRRISLCGLGSCRS